MIKKSVRSLRFLAALLAAVSTASCVSGPPDIRTGLVGEKEIQSPNHPAYMLVLRSAGNDRTANYTLWSLGGDTRLPIQQYSLACRYDHENASVMIYGREGDGPLECPRDNPALPFSKANKSTGRPIEAHFYRDSEKRFFHKYKGRIADSSSPFVLSVTYSDNYPFMNAVTAGLHEIFHIKAALSPTGLSEIDEEINAELFGLCLVDPAVYPEFSESLVKRANEAAAATEITDTESEQTRAVHSALDLEYLLQGVLEYKDAHEERERSTYSKKIKFIYQFLPALVFRYLAFDQAGDPTPDRFEALCNRLSSENFSRPLTMHHIKHADETLPSGSLGTQ